MEAVAAAGKAVEMEDAKASAPSPSVDPPSKGDPVAFQKLLDACCAFQNSNVLDLLCKSGQVTTTQIVAWAVELYAEGQFGLFLDRDLVGRVAKSKEGLLSPSVRPADAAAAATWDQLLIVWATIGLHGCSYDYPNTRAFAELVSQESERGEVEPRALAAKAWALRRQSEGWPGELALGSSTTSSSKPPENDQ